MNDLEFIFIPSMLNFILKPFLFVIITVLIIIILTIYLVKKELNKRSVKNEK